MNEYLMWVGAGVTLLILAYLGWRVFLLWFCREQYITYISAANKDDDGMGLVGTLFMQSGYQNHVYVITRVFQVREHEYVTRRLALYGRRHRP